MSVPLRFVDEIPFGMWWENPANIADLIEFLRFRRAWDENATDYLLRHPDEFESAWDEMQALGGSW